MNDATFSLRNASTPADAKQLFEWRNQPFIWQRGSSQRTVSWEEHKTWFNASLQNPDRIIYMVELGSVPIGMVRFDRAEASRCVISAYLAEEHVGHGLGVAAISIACRLIATNWHVGSIFAHVRKDNPSGLIGFRKAGFNPCELTDKVAGHEVLVYACGELQ